MQINRSYYTYQRYKVETAFALLYHHGALGVETLARYLRLSDQFVRYDAHHYFIVFAHTNAANAYKASQNLLLNLDNYFNDRSSAIAIDLFDPSNSVQIVLGRLSQILDVAKATPDARIQDETVLDRRL
ncbi:MAG: hypothetical protein JXK05_05590 [Campylobacterales bacterium]|nr:hypothetical protein [Campylobacterales bacterium]